MLGFGSASVWTVAVDATGRMISSELSSQIERAKREGYSPIYVNATAGSTVLGSYDPFSELAQFCRTHSIWLHIDASWGGPAIFSSLQAHKMAGPEKADSLSLNPHKKMGVPITCSFLLGADMRQFHKSNTSAADYLFHHGPSTNEDADIYDLADLTLQCGRRGDSLKLALSWIYYGKRGHAEHIERAFDTATYMASRISNHPSLKLVSTSPPPCLQVCFYYAPGKKLCPEAEGNSEATERITAKLVTQGYMIDFASGVKGKFFRVVVNRDTRRETVDGLLNAIEEAGKAGLMKIHPYLAA